MERGIPVIAASQYSLIVTVVNRGYSDQVMKAAQLGGATGGTVLLSRGVGNHEVEKFLGFSIQPEKEVVLVLTEKEPKQEIMKAICQACGFCTPAKGLSFALPVDEAFGFPQSAFPELGEMRKTGS